ncbi:hypothetical protein V6N11_052087 [Hibiscus sabdariffa]|uniref:Uncharacterized protein n=1 Tax=Hibiscus sabdariffa TaxID=183260 RepID=A0ABR2U954_9ROSI
MIYLSPRFGSPNDGPDEALLLLGRVVAGPERSWAWSRKACSTVAGFVTGRRAHANWTRTRDRVVTCSYPSRVAAGPGVQGPGFHLSPSLATVLFPVAFQIAPDLDLKGFSLHFKTWNNRGSGQIATFSGTSATCFADTWSNILRKHLPGLNSHTFEPNGRILSLASFMLAKAIIPLWV